MGVASHFPSGLLLWTARAVNSHSLTVPCCSCMPSRHVPPASPYTSVPSSCQSSWRAIVHRRSSFALGLTMCGVSGTLTQVTGVPSLFARWKTSTSSSAMSSGNHFLEGKISACDSCIQSTEVTQLRGEVLWKPLFGREDISLRQLHPIHRGDTAAR